LGRHGGALLADAVGLGKSYVALAVALALSEPFALVVPAVLVRQWRGLLERYDADAPIITHESLSVNPCRPLPPSTAPYRLFVVDEAHRFRNPLTNRYRALAKLVVGARVLLVTATPVHNRIADLFHLFRLFLRDHDLTALGVPSLSRAARGDADPHAVTAAAARLSVSRSRERVQAGYDAGPGALPFPERAAGEAIRVGTAPDVQLQELVTGVRLLEARVGKTIVFVQPRATVHYLMHRLRGHRLAAVTGERGWFGKEPTGREDVLRAFAPRAQRAPLPRLALETDVLIATDILSE